VSQYVFVKAVTLYLVCKVGNAVVAFKQAQARKRVDRYFDEANMMKRFVVRRGNKRKR
jgi:hypothetical protein